MPRAYVVTYTRTGSLLTAWQEQREPTYPYRTAVI